METIKGYDNWKLRGGDEEREDQLLDDLRHRDQEDWREFEADREMDHNR